MGGGVQRALPLFRGGKLEREVFHPVFLVCKLFFVGLIKYLRPKHYLCVAQTTELYRDISECKPNAHLHSGHFARRILPKEPLHPPSTCILSLVLHFSHRFFPAFMKTPPPASYFSGISLPIDPSSFSSICLSSPGSVLKEPRGLAWQPGTGSQDSPRAPWGAPPGKL